MRRLAALAWAGRGRARGWRDDAMGSAPGPHPDYLIILVGPGSGAGAGVPGVAVREAATGRVTDRIISETEGFAAVASTATNRQFFLAVREDPQTAGAR